MKYYYLTGLLLAVLPSLYAQDIAISRTESKTAFTIADKLGSIPIVLDSADFPVVSIAAKALQSDIKDITGSEPPVVHYSIFNKTTAIIVGTIGKSKIINTLIESNKLSVTSIANKWETYQIQLVNDPIKGVKQALVIVGSDRRGTAFGIFELSRMMGISPWKWWADVRPGPSEKLFVTPGKPVSALPSVKYRGIFINDEGWGLLPWAAKKMDTDIQDIGPKTYAHVFELLLRLKANLIWPAMHDGKAFYYYKQDPVVADRYAIVVGSSHCEQMLRSNVFEWVKNFDKEYDTKPGEWSYDINKEQMDRYWDDRVKESRNYESVYTLGIRGVHDSPMLGPKDKTGKISLLGTAISNQRHIFEKYYNNAATVPQIFCPYKEVLGLYQGGLKLPEDVTLVWVDDNHGYVRQLSTPAEQKRSGGSGMYYHISYWGAPHDYLWLSTISPSLMSYEMTKSFQFGASRMWVLNVGDIKPNEMETQFFMDLAWDINKWNPENAHKYSQYWAEQTFGKEVAPQIASIKNDFFKLTQNAKPEHLRMLQFDAAIRTERLVAGAALNVKVDKVKVAIPNRLQSAFYQLIEYPVKGNDLMNQKIFNAQTSLDLAKKGDTSALVFAQKSQLAFNQIHELTKKYNTGIENGKWDGMMDDAPRSLPVFSMPPVATAAMLAMPDSIKLITKSKYVDNYDGASSEEKADMGEVSVYAANYKLKQDLDNDRLMVVEGLGLGCKSVSRYPFTGLSYKDEEFEKAPYVEYAISISTPKKELSVKCLPTQAIHEGRGLRMAISINGGLAKIVDVSHSKEDAVWSANVLRGYSEATMPVSFDKAGTYTIRIYLLDTGLALSKIDIR